MDLLAERIQYVNPVQLNEAVQGMVAATARLLEYERFHDRLEMIKLRSSTLPSVVEQRVGQSIQRTVLDAQAMSHLLSGLVAEMEEVGVMEALIPSLAQLEPASVPELLKGRSDVLEDWLDHHGMPRELWQWAFQYAKWDDMSFTTEGDTIVVHRGGHRIGAVTGSRAPAGDAASFVTRALGLPPRYRQSAGAKDAPGFSPAAIVQIAMREVETFYVSRARRTATDGVQALPTGIPVLVVLIIIAAVILIVGITLTLLCGSGVITDRKTCAVAPYFLLVGFLALLVLGFGQSNTRFGDEDTEENSPINLDDPDG